MNKFIIGKKIGMSRIFSENGIDIPITVIEAGPCPITQIKNNDIDGYSSIQLGYDDFTEKKSTKAILGHLKASSSNPKKVLKEFKVDSSDGYKLGENITLSSFSVGESVNVTGISKGKGFTGHMKRHGFGGGRRSHGKNSVMRKAGSIGAGSDPSRVWPGTRMAGRHGNKTVKVENLEIVKLNESNNLMYVKGSVPGSVNGYLYLEVK